MPAPGRSDRHPAETKLRTARFIAPGQTVRTPEPPLTDAPFPSHRGKNLTAAVSPHFAYYNLSRVHASLGGKTPQWLPGSRSTSGRWTT